MKTRFAIALSLGLAGMSAPTFAHDPSQHQTKDAAAPDCTKMKDMDKMDMNDPVMKAMRAQCEDHMPGDDATHDDMHDHDMADGPEMESKAEPPAPEDEH